MLIRHILLGLCVLATSLAHAQKLPDVDSYLTKLDVSYEKNLIKIKEADQSSRRTLQKKYAGNLLGIERKLKETGQLDPLLVTRKEMARFKKTGSLEGADGTGSPDLQRLLGSYKRLFNDLDLNTSKRLYSLSGKFDNSLAGLQESYTKADRIEDALKVKEAREAFKERPDVLEALAAMQVEKERQEAARLNQPPPERWKPANAEAKPPAVANKFKSSDKKRISDRYEDFIDALKDEDMDGVVDLVNPAETREVGRQLVALAFAPFAPMIKVADKLGADFRSGKVKVAEDEQTAIQIPFYAGPDEHKDMDPVHWVKVEGDWYIRLGKDQ